MHPEWMLCATSKPEEDRVSIPWEQSYEGQLRKLIGNRTLMIPAAAAWLGDAEGRILLIRRRDNDEWGWPGGALELGETILEGLAREVREETGLEVLSPTPMAVYSGSRLRSVNRFGNDCQLLMFVFLAQQWSGSLVSQTDETVDARFFDMRHLPDLPARYQERIEDLKNFHGAFMVK